MPNYYKSSAGSRTLTAAQSAIRREEAFGSKFIKSQLEAVEGVITNLITFERLDELLPSVHLVLRGAPAPAAHQLIWTGVMLVSGANSEVHVYRADT